MSLMGVLVSIGIMSIVMAGNIEMNRQQQEATKSQRILSDIHNIVVEKRLQLLTTNDINSITQPQTYNGFSFDSFDVTKGDKISDHIYKVSINARVSKTSGPKQVMRYISTVPCLYDGSTIKACGNVSEPVNNEHEEHHDEHNGNGDCDHH